MPAFHFYLVISVKKMIELLCFVGVFVYNLGFFATRVHGVSIVLTWQFIIANRDNQPMRKGPIVFLVKKIIIIFEC